MKTATPSPARKAVDELIDALTRKYGSLRKAAAALEFDHQKLSYHRRRAKKLPELMAILERCRKAVGMSKSKAWDALLADLKNQ